MRKPELKPDLVALEHDVLEYWKEHRTFDRLRESRKNAPAFRFLDGPITANNPMGIHHAWGRTLKDIFLRYKAMRGYTSNWQNGFDSQGLWVEVEVEKELGFAGKQDIEAYGIENFIERCKERVDKYSGIQTEQSIRLGQWMDWDHSYYTNTDLNIAGIWHFLQQCHERGWLYEADKLLPWCPRCGTSLSEHEMAGSYRDVSHRAVFVRAPLVERDASILVWTTTPWTLAANVALAVHPSISYCEVRLPGEERTLILARESLGVLEAKPEVLRVFEGKELIGLHYETFFPDLPVQEGIEHRVVGWELVEAGEGTGVVHIAPGCGAEDFELAQEEDLPVVRALEEYGGYIEGFGWLEGKKALDVAGEVIAYLDREGRLFRAYDYEHRYPVCWRCKTETVFRLVDEWFLRSDEIRPLMQEAARKVRWQPEHIGKLMEDWLHNMGDWNISRKRFYGLPLPFYPCTSCGTLTVVGSKEELLERAAEPVVDLPELHRPWVDHIRIACPSCGTEVERIPEIGDVWLDAGIVPYSTLGYFDDRERWEKFYPAEWIVEMREQVRLWFYSMLFMSVTLHNRAPYEHVLSYESVVAENGTRFSKTGHMIRFDDAVERLGADTIRYLFAGANVANNVRFGFGLGAEVRRQQLALWSVYSFFGIYARLDRPRLEGYRPDPAALTVTDHWVLLRTNAFLKLATEAMEGYSTPDLVRAFEEFVDDLSNWYIRVNRRRFWKSEDTEDKRVAYWCLYQALHVMTRVMAPIMPFMTERIWQDGVAVFDSSAPDSVHLSDWPEPLDVPADETLLEDTAFVREVISLAHRSRNQARMKVRQPLATLWVVVGEDRREAVRRLSDIVVDEVNVKAVRFLDDVAALEVPYLGLDFKEAGPFLQKDVGKVKNLLADLEGGAMAEAVAAYRAGGEVALPGWADPLPAKLFVEESRPREDVVIESEGGLTVGLDVQLTEDLVLEGLARDVVRQVQVARKEAGLEVEDRIVLDLETGDDTLQQAISRHSTYIADETLTDTLGNNLSAPLVSKTVEIAGHEVLIALERSA